MIRLITLNHIFNLVAKGFEINQFIYFVPLCSFEIVLPYMAKQTGSCFCRFFISWNFYQLAEQIKQCASIL